VVTYNMFQNSGCPLQDTFASNDGPWCQDSCICNGSETACPTASPTVRSTASSTNFPTSVRPFVFLFIPFVLYF